MRGEQKGKNLTARVHSLFNWVTWPSKTEDYQQSQAKAKWTKVMGKAQWNEIFCFSFVFVFFFYCRVFHWNWLEGSVQFSSRTIRTVFHSVHTEILLAAPARWTRPSHKYAQSLILPATSIKPFFVYSTSWRTQKPPLGGHLHNNYAPSPWKTRPSTICILMVLYNLHPFYY